MAFKTRPLNLPIHTPAPTCKVKGAKFASNVEGELGSDEEEVSGGYEEFDELRQRYRKVYSGSSKTKKDHYPTLDVWSPDGF